MSYHTWLQLQQYSSGSQPSGYTCGVYLHGCGMFPLFDHNVTFGEKRSWSTLLNTTVVRNKSVKLIEGFLCFGKLQEPVILEKIMHRTVSVCR